MNKLKKLYRKGITYKEYIETGSLTDKAKHVHYLEKMKFDIREKRCVLKIKQQVRLLVFCNINCADCRITLAVLENMRIANPLLQYRIVDREGNRAVMQKADKNCRIPLIVDISTGIKIYNEIPESLKNKTKKEPLSKLRTSYRKGFYKKDIINQILSYLA